MSMSLGLMFSVSRKGDSERLVCAHQKGTNSMAMSGLTCRKTLIDTGRAVSVLVGINELRNKLTYLVGPPFVAFIVRFSAMPGWHFLRAWIESLLDGGCG